MKKCPTCGNSADVLITNVQDRSQFCAGCAPATFLPHYVLTCEDVKFFMACGIDPQLPAVLMDAVKAELRFA
jgi:hypothetical protein